MIGHGHEMNLLSYTKLLAAHVNNFRHEKAIILFQRMHANPSLTLDPFVFPLALKSTTALHLPYFGSSIHAHTIKTCFISSPFVSCALVDMYGKCVSTNLARKMFDEIPHRNVVVWNSMISLYASSKNISSALKLFECMDVEPNASTFNSVMAAMLEVDGGGTRALEFYRRMGDFGIKSTLVTLLAMLPACVGDGALNLVKEIHGYSIRSQIYGNLQLSSGLIELYGRCGSLRNARCIFQGMHVRDVVVWSSMVSAYALHGETEMAVRVFEEMKSAMVQPDGIAFLGVFKACSHAGFADEALKYFREMQTDYRIKATAEHYSCLVDVLSRVGRLREAYEVIRGMPMKATASAWGALLAACRIYKEVELAQIAGEVLFNIEPNNAANYVLLATVYAGIGRLDEVERVKRRMRDNGIKAFPGGSWVGL